MFLVVLKFCPNLSLLQDAVQKLSTYPSADIHLIQTLSARKHMNIFSEQSDIKEYYAGSICNKKLRKNCKASIQIVYASSVITSLCVHDPAALSE